MEMDIKKNVETNNDSILGTEKIYKLFIKFCIPAVLCMVLNGIQVIIDGIFISNFIGENAMASVNIAQPFMSIIMGLSFVMCTGAISLIGRKLGQGDKKEGQNAFKTSIIVLFVASVTVGSIGVIWGPQIAGAFGASNILIDDTITYIRVISFFAPFVCMMFLLGFTGRLMDRPDLYLKASIALIFSNIILNYIFLKVLNLGVAGAALATGLSFTVASFIVSSTLFKKDNLLNIYVGKFKKEYIGQMVYNGSSEGINSIAAAITTFLFNLTFIKMVGESGVIAYTAIGYVTTFTNILLFGIADGTTPIISYNYGKNSMKRVQETVVSAIKINIIFSILLFCLLFFGGEYLVKIFIKDKEIIEFATNGAKIYAFSILLSGVNIVMSSYFTSIGKAMESVIVAGSRGIIFMILGIIFLPMIFGTNGIWATVVFAEIGAFVISILFMIKLRPKLNKG